MASAYDGDAVLFAKETYNEPEFKPPPKREKTKVPMQKLHMSVENQEMVKDMLKDLHGGEDLQQLEELEEDTYEELDWRAEDQYWTEDSKMNVEETTVLAAEPSNVNASTFSRVALQKLQRYGFEKARCQDALEVFEGDIGKSLELLLSQCFELKLNIAKTPKSNGEYDAYDEDYYDPHHEAESDVNLEEILEQRQDEKMALEAIYGDIFMERIPNTVWCISLELPHLTDMLKQKKDIKVTKATTVLQKLRERRKEKESTELCRFFLKGNCKFGNRCRQLHQRKNAAAEGFIADETPDNYCPYTLEIRFPPGNKYPMEPPFVAFYSASDDLPNATVLNITSRLVTEAKEQAESGCPAVFSMASILDDVAEIKHLLEEEPLPYSMAAPVISRLQGEYEVRKQQEVEAITNKGRSKELQSLVDKQKEYLTRPTKDDPAQNGEEEEEEEKLTPEDLRKRYALKDVVQRAMDPREIERINLRLKDQFRRKQNQDSYMNMVAGRQKLPAWDNQDKIKQILNSNQVMVVSGMTGCGKTTQVPQFILDSYLRQKGAGVCNIICTQPRRISAMAVAERVADERTERLGGIVGYQIRLESVMSARTRLLFCTTGILLRRLESDMALEGVSHVIIDEVHERSEDSDFLMMVLRDLLPKRRDLKVVLMSATMNAELFSEYFGQCPMLEIPGRTFHVDQFFLEDAIECTGYMIEERSPFSRPLKRANAVRQGSTRQCAEEIIEDLETCNVEDLAPPKDNIQDQNLSVKQLYTRYCDYQKTTIKTMATMDHEKINNDLIEALVEWIVGGDHEFPRDGAILVFLPGIAEITSVYEQLLSHRSLGGKSKSKFRIIPLHSTLSSEEQHAVFRPSREGVTKIVLATNIAETSITIDDVVYVIDCGRMKEKRYDASKGMESLETVWVSRANAQQRKGRAGRVAEGVCFHLFTGHRYDNHMRDQPIPEIQRAPLESLVLKIKLLDIFAGQDVKEVLLKLVESPSSETVQSALKRLQDLGALDPTEDLTPLGYHLGQLPVDVRIGKLMLFGAIFQCLDPALTIAATLSFKSPFVAPFEKRDEADRKRKELAVGNSDHLTMLKAYRGWAEAQKHGNHAGYSYCQENFLSIKTLQMLGSMKRQFTELLSDIGFVQEGLTVRDMERRGRQGSDGVREATGAMFYFQVNANSENTKLVAAILVAALFPNVVQVSTPEAKYQQTSAGAISKMFKPEDLKFKTKPDGYISIHPASINFQVRYFESPYLVYHEKVKTSKVFIRDSTMVSVYPLLLFGGGSMSIDLDRGKFILSVDEGWIRFMAASHQIAELVKELRIELDQLLQDKIETPNMDLCTCPRGSKIIPTIVKLVSTQ